MATFVIVVIQLIRGIGKHYLSRKLISLLWLFVVLRLLIPVAIPSNLSLIHLMEGYFVKNVPIVIDITNENQTELSFSNVIQEAREYNPLVYKTEGFELFLEVMSIIWILGVCIVLSVFLISQLTLSRQLNLRKNLKYTDIIGEIRADLGVKKKVECYLSSSLRTPVVIGMFRPKIILPIHIEEEIINLVFLHELIHIKHNHNTYKAIYLLATALHWFNPMVWLSLGQCALDIELACDEEVLNLIHPSERKKYATSLILMNEKSLKLGQGYSNSPLTDRIEHIIRYKKMTKYMVFLLTAFYIILGLVLSTN